MGFSFFEPPAFFLDVSRLPRFPGDLWHGRPFCQLLPISADACGHCPLDAVVNVGGINGLRGSWAWKSSKLGNFPKEKSKIRLRAESPQKPIITITCEFCESIHLYLPLSEVLLEIIKGWLWPFRRDEGPFSNQLAQGYVDFCFGLVFRFDPEFQILHLTRGLL